jgi:HD-GYP domain-containing protein (c-di-GMP phosphodiesterase class II)
MVDRRQAAGDGTGTGGSRSGVAYVADPLAALNKTQGLGQCLAAIHAALGGYFEFIDRVAVAVYDEQTDTLKTFLASSGGDEPLQHYEAALASAPSLRETILSRRPRVVNDLAVFAGGTREHTRRIRDQGYGASCTFPLFLGDRVLGCVFFDSYRKGCFGEDVVRVLSLFSHLVARVVGSEWLAARTLRAALKTVNDMVHHKDPETGNHLERMSRFTRLIAQDLCRAGDRDLDDEFVESLFLFSPLHDVGKIGIPDAVLLKPARLEGEEWEVMKSHARKGRAMVDAIIANFGMESVEPIDLLRHIAEHHHETVDGGGYPDGLVGDEIPLGARVVAVADVFDALTSRRPYKEPWTNDEAFRYLKGLAREKLDAACVEALARNRPAVEAIQQQFREEEEAVGEV